MDAIKYSAAKERRLYLGVEGICQDAMFTPNWGTPEIHVRFAIPVNTQSWVSNHTIRKPARRRSKTRRRL